MPLSAKFQADFSDFTRAVDQAEIKLRSFETNAGKVGTALNRMADSFSGRKVIQDAELMVRAIGGVEGASKLTKDEQQRANTTLDEALAKYKALGIEAPAELQKVSAELSKQQIGFTELATAAAAVGGIVAGVSAGVGKLGERGASVNDVADSFGALSAAIGESSTAMIDTLRTATLGTISDFDLMKVANEAMSQGLDLTAEQFGQMGETAAVLADRLGIDTSTAFETLSRAMATGQDRTLKTIGMNIDAEKAVRDYAASIGKVPAALDESEKKHAIQNAILAEGQKVVGLSGKAQEDFGDKIGQSRVKLTNLIDSIGTWVATSPSIGGWTSAITAVAGSVSAIGVVMGPVSKGISALLPMLGLSGGLAGAFGAVGTVITTTVLPAMGTALAALAPFAIPLAGLAVAIGAVYLAWKHWDAITGFVKATYEGVKTWLFDKLTGIFDSVKGKIDMVTGAFKSMYDKVVGHSYVTDMIEGIDAKFSRLNAIMVAPTQTATQSVETLFAKTLDNLTKRLTDFVHGFLPKWGAGLSGGMGSIANMASGVFGNLLTGGVSAAINAVAALAMKGIAKLGSMIGRAFKGGEQGVVVNPMRDQWFSAHGDLAGVNQAAFAAGDTDLRTTQAIFAAKTQADFDRATAEWERLTGKGFAAGTGGKFLDFGTGTNVRLHGRERIVTEAEGAAAAGLTSAIEERLASIERYLRKQPVMMAVAVRDALVLAG